MTPTPRPGVNALPKPGWRPDPDPLSVDRLGTEVVDLASAWRSCLVRLALVALVLMVVGLVVAQLGSDVR